MRIKTKFKQIQDIPECLGIISENSPSFHVWKNLAGKDVIIDNCRVNTNIACCDSVEWLIISEDIKEIIRNGRTMRPDFEYTVCRHMIEAGN